MQNEFLSIIDLNGIKFLLDGLMLLVWVFLNEHNDLKQTYEWIKYMTVFLHKQLNF